MKLLFASNNVNKVHEIRKIMLLSYEIVTLNDLGFDEELPETGTTLDSNAMQKAKFVFEKIKTIEDSSKSIHKNILPQISADNLKRKSAASAGNKLIGMVGCFADDTGLEVEALNGDPGVYSARYAGSDKSAEDNIAKLLFELKGKPNRNARFRTVIAAILNTPEGVPNPFGDLTFYCEGIIKGEILFEKKGTNGFGYDPVFKPDGYDCSFAEMPLEEKNKISHRAMAVRRFVEELEKVVNG